MQIVAIVALVLLACAFCILATGYYVGLTGLSKVAKPESRGSVVVALVFFSTVMVICLYMAADYSANLDFWKSLGRAGAWLMALGSLLQLLAILDSSRGGKLFKRVVARERLSALGWAALLMGSVATAASLSAG